MRRVLLFLDLARSRSALLSVSEPILGAMLATGQFYVLWLIYFLGASVGLTVISQVAPLAATMPKTAAALTGGMTMGIVAVFNGVGRLIWGSISDRLGRAPVRRFASAGPPAPKRSTSSVEPRRIVGAVLQVDHGLEPAVVLHAIGEGVADDGNVFAGVELEGGGGVES